MAQDPPTCRVHVLVDQLSVFSRRRLVVATIILAGIWSAYALELDFASLIPASGGLQLAGEFLSAALAPAVEYESEVPAGTMPLLLRVLYAAKETVLLAAASIGLAAVAGFLLGVVASNSFWFSPGGDLRASPARSVSAMVKSAFLIATRVLITLMRSVHELLWAVMFLAAFGVSRLSAVIALAIPFTGVLAKIFSELVDEAPRQGAIAVHTAGGTALNAYCLALVPCALPDILAYTLYRFECALRSAAVMGFFGFPTFGFYIAASFENLHYAEVWTYLYGLVLLVAMIDWWSGGLRRRLV